MHMIMLNLESCWWNLIRVIKEPHFRGTIRSVNLYWMDGRTGRKFHFFQIHSQYLGTRPQRIRTDIHSLRRIYAEHDGQMVNGIIDKLAWKVVRATKWSLCAMMQMGEMRQVTGVCVWKWTIYVAKILAEMHDSCRHDQVHAILAATGIGNQHLRPRRLELRK